MSFLMPAPYLPITKVDFMLGRIVCHPFYQRRKKRSKASPVLNQFPNKIIFLFFFFLSFSCWLQRESVPHEHVFESMYN